MRGSISGSVTLNWCACLFWRMAESISWLANTRDERGGQSQGHGTGFFEASEIAQGSFVDEEEGHVRSMPKLLSSTLLQYIRDTFVCRLAGTNEQAQGAADARRATYPPN